MIIPTTWCCVALILGAGCRAPSPPVDAGRPNESSSSPPLEGDAGLAAARIGFNGGGTPARPERETLAFAKEDERIRAIAIGPTHTVVSVSDPTLRKHWVGMLVAGETTPHWVVSAKSQILGLAIDGEYIYFSTGSTITGSTINRLGITGGRVTVVARRASAEIRAMLVYEKRLLWVEEFRSRETSWPTARLVAMDLRDRTINVLRTTSTIARIWRAEGGVHWIDGTETREGGISENLRGWDAATNEVRTLGGRKNAVVDDGDEVYFLRCSEAERPGDCMLFRTKHGLDENREDSAAIEYLFRDVERDAAFHLIGRQLYAQSPTEVWRVEIPARK